MVLHYQELTTTLITMFVVVEENSFNRLRRLIVWLVSTTNSSTAINGVRSSSSNTLREHPDEKLKLTQTMR